MQLYQHQSHFKKCSKLPFPPTAYKLPNQAQRVRNPIVCPYILLLFILYAMCIYIPIAFVLFVHPYLCSTYSSTSNCSVFISISCLRAFEDFDFVIALAGFNSPLIYLTFAISLCLYAQQRHIISIISYFSCIIPSLTKYLYNNFESIQRISSKSMFNTKLIVLLTVATISNL